MNGLCDWLSLWVTVTLRRDWSWQSAAPPLSPAYFKSHLKIPHTPSNNILTRYSEFQSIDNQFGGLPSWARGRIALNNYTFCSIQILQTIFVCDLLCLCVCSFHCHWPREIWSGELFAGVSCVRLSGLTLSALTLNSVFVASDSTVTRGLAGQYCALQTEPIRGQDPGHMITLHQSEASIIHCKLYLG